MHTQAPSNARGWEGKGKMIFAEGGYYEGEWKNDMPNGKGIYSYANGEKYEGLLYVCGCKTGLWQVLLYRITPSTMANGPTICAKGGTLIHENGEKISSVVPGPAFKQRRSSFGQSKYSTFFRCLHTKFRP
ncbi:MAG: hypothetical protein IPO69_15950 [Saprospiraceae bacterium]|nr:hypothetical protein [Saprospiraceae bacterium]